jgi:serine/threonine protein kinase
MSSEPELDDPRVVAALEQYLAAIEAGERPNRQAFLARHADVAEALAECLDGIEALHVAAPSPQPSNSAPGLPGTAAEWPPGTPLGDFRILREIGRGGMGVVYEAVQLSLDRRVALKVLPFAAALDAKQLQRFKNEAQAAAHLHHTNIVPVYAVGSERGVHFYAMQLIEGQNLAAVVEDLRRAALPGSTALPSRPEDEPTGPYPPPPVPARAPRTDTHRSLGAQLSTRRSDRAAEFFRTVARLTTQAAEGLDYAHGMGVIHRDIKPANLLVDVRGNVWITDFGLAQFHADGGLTQTGDLLGTLRYMSPEQAGGQRVLIDHRTDVYSLGATLYELLTLRPIFDGEDRQTLSHQILNQEPRPPRSLDRSIPPELETIVLKAVSKSPAERYATARDFAEDLQRFLRNEPIRARRPTTWQRGRKWLRRHPSVLIAGSVLLVLLAAGSLVSAWLIEREQAKTQRAYQQEQQRFQLARRAVDEMIQLAEEELADRPHLEGPRKRLLETALVYYQELIEQRRDDPSAQAELVATRAKVQKILDNLAVLQGAGKLFLLAEPAVLDDLQPSDEQRASIDELSRRLAAQRQDKFRAYRQLSPEERQQRFLELARDNDAAVRAILTAGQRTRLKQIALQLQGPSAFREASIANALKLTADQKERIRAIEAETFFGMPERRRHGPGPRDARKPRDQGPPDPWGPPGVIVTLRDTRKTREQALKAANDKIFQLLTAEQRQQWRELTGKPFEGEITLRPPPGPFGPPGPR